MSPSPPRTRTLTQGRLRVSWADADDRRHTIDASLDMAWLAAPRERHINPNDNAIGEAACREVREWGAQRGLHVDARPDGFGLQVNVTGPSEAVDRHRPHLHAALEAARDRATYAAGYRRSPGGKLVVDLPRLATRYAPKVAPLARALLATVPRRDYATYAARALAFVQVIPYRAEVRVFTLPAGVLAEDHGDCDEKSLLLLALLKAAFPAERAVVLHPPQHALLGLPVPAGPHRVAAHGRRWALCEPAGPALLPLGTAGTSTLEDLRSSSAPVLLVP